MRYLCGSILLLYGALAFAQPECPAAEETPARQAQQAPAANQDPDQIRSAMLVWKIGTNLPNGPTRMVETITRATLNGQVTWRITHYPHDVAAMATSDFDTYDVDAATLAPVRSIMRNPGFELRLDFGKDRVRLQRTAESKTAQEEFPVEVAVAPEGPGSTVFIGGLPLREGYTLRYYIVDRWDGVQAGRVKPVCLTVVRRRWMQTAIGRQDTFELLIEPEDKSFHIVEHVRAQPPHYPLSIEYVRGDYKLLSEVVELVL